LSDLYVEQVSGIYMVATKLVSTGGASRSLRTTVPLWVVEHFELSAGDTVEWKFLVEDGKMQLIVTPKKE
jgi:hypothetical protein